MRNKLLLLSVLMLFCLIGTAQATLIGDEVSYNIAVTSFDYSVASGAGVTTVGAGVEVDPLITLSPWLALDVEASSFSFIYDNVVNRAIRTLEFTLADLDWNAPGTQVTSATFLLNDIENAVASISTTANSVSITLDNVDGNYFTWEIGDQLSVQINTAPVPEPGTFLLLGAGLGGLMIYRRRSRK